MNHDDKQAVLAIFKAAEEPLELLDYSTSKRWDGRTIKLDLHGCSTLTTLPPKIGNLNQLTGLNLSQFKKLNQLTELPSSGCSSLMTPPPEIGRLHGLTDLSHCTSLTTLRPEIGRLQGLTEFNRSGCSSLTTVPPEIGNLDELTDLEDRDEELKVNFKDGKSDQASAQVKDLQRLPQEMQNRIATLAAKKTSQERQGTITKVSGTGWERGPDCEDGADGRDLMRYWPE